MGSREALDDSEKGKVCCPTRIRTPEHSAHRPASIPITIPRLLIKNVDLSTDQFKRKRLTSCTNDNFNQPGCPYVTRRHIPPTHRMHAHTHPLFLSLKHTFRNSRMHVPGVRDFPITCRWIPSAWPRTATDFCQITSSLCSVL